MKFQCDLIEIRTERDVVIEAETETDAINQIMSRIASATNGSRVGDANGCRAPISPMPTEIEIKIKSMQAVNG